MANQVTRSTVHDMARAGHCGKLAASVVSFCLEHPGHHATLGDAADVAITLDLLAPQRGEPDFEEFRSELLTRMAILLGEDCPADEVRDAFTGEALDAIEQADVHEEIIYRQSRCPDCGAVIETRSYDTVDGIFFGAVPWRLTVHVRTRALDGTVTCSERAKDSQS